MAEWKESLRGLESTILADNARDKKHGCRIPCPARHLGATDVLSSRPRKSLGNPARVGAGLRRDSFETLEWRPGEDTHRKQACSTSKQILTVPGENPRHPSALALPRCCAEPRLKRLTWQKAGGSWFRKGEADFRSAPPVALLSPDPCCVVPVYVGPHGRGDTRESECAGRGVPCEGDTPCTG